MYQLIELPIHGSDACQKMFNHAERELSAFICAIVKTFGVDQARQSINDWMEELEFADFPDDRSNVTCRRVTIAAAARLTDRIWVKRQQRVG